MSPVVVAFLGLGSNVGDRAANLRQAVGMLSAMDGLTVERVAGLYETEPVGVTDQPWFLNTALQIRTRLSPHDLLLAVKDVEAAAGRTPTYRWGPREIDVDVLLYDDLSVSDGDLTIPHPRMHERLFALLPLRDLLPGWRDATGMSIDALIDRLGGTSEIRPYSERIDLFP